MCRIKGIRLTPEEIKEHRKNNQKKYRLTHKKEIEEYNEKYRSTPKGKEVQKNYQSSTKGKEVTHKQGKKNYYSLRERAIKKLGSKCVGWNNQGCPFNSHLDTRCLQIDHKFGNGTKERKDIGNNGIYRKILKDSTGYQLLCANCNWIKRKKNKEDHSKGDI